MAIIRILAPDAVGIVSQLAKTVRDHGANWLESGFSRVGGQFVGLVRVSVPQEQKPNLQQALQQLPEAWQIRWYETEASELAPSVTLQLLGDDRPGIMDELARTVREMNASIIRLQSRVYEAPMSNELLFEATLQVSCEPEQLQALCQRLESLGDSLMVDLKTQTQLP